MNIAGRKMRPAPEGAVRTIPAEKMLPVFGVVIVLSVALATVDVALVRVAQRRRIHTAQELFEHGRQLRAAGKTGEALEAFRAAYNRNPGNPVYQTGLIRALRAADRHSQARNLAAAVLEEHPAYGQANLEMARILADAGELRQAAFFYHRALYGEWTDNAELRAIRFELADLLAKGGAKEELLSEVLLLDSGRQDQQDARRLARLFLAAEAWPRAEQEYSDLLRNNQKDSGLWLGLGRAQLGAGKYLAAERSFRRAAALAPNNRDITNELAVVAEVNQTDPMLRRLGSGERHRRAHQLLTSLLAPLLQCAPNSETLIAMEKGLAAHGRSRNLPALTERDLDLVDQLWSTRLEICPTGLRVPERVELLASRISR
jgi:tetratricopeptide (TPR) repeat protein